MDVHTAFLNLLTIILYYISKHMEVHTAFLNLLTIILYYISTYMEVHTAFLNLLTIILYYISTHKEVHTAFLNLLKYEQLVLLNQQISFIWLVILPIVNSIMSCNVRYNLVHGMKGAESQANMGCIQSN